ncbi:uncharacterized protein LOC124414497 [Diprion similis]|uniref:uncharacterized protein LOC124414497 n=1 Tax=Diprion similis TaxID=362088 RepID=UPI001EF93762|nr:uncharacterized protein LOC124414497 [Diprion similis]
MDIKGKIALVTGGANGIGFAYVKELLRNGAAKVAILDLATSNGMEVAKNLNSEFGHGKVIFVASDVTKTKEFEAGFAKAFEECGGLDIVINNAGIMDDTKWELMVDINYNGVVRGTLLGLKYMGKNMGGKGGTIVNVSSIVGCQPSPIFPIYAGTKYAVIGLTRSFAAPENYNNTGVRLLAICPDVTETQLITKSVGRSLSIINTNSVTETFSEMQSTESVAKAMMQIIREGENGSSWLVTNAEPPCEVDIPDKVVRKVTYTDMDVKGKTALITGGANGIGFAYAVELLRNGVARVAILDLANSNGDKAVRKLENQFGNGKAMFIVCDVTKAQQLEDAFAKIIEDFGGLDIVVNNAGIMDDNRWELEININVTALVRGTLLGLKYMGIDNGGKGGTIVNVSSIAGVIPLLIFPVYCATKHAVIGLTRSFGQPYHYEKTNVRVIAICPSVTNTQLMTEAEDRKLDGITVDVIPADKALLPLQSVENVARGLLYILRVAEPGTSWLVEKEKQPELIVIPDEPVTQT